MSDTVITSKNASRRRLTGTVMSAAMKKSVVVRVDRTVTHPKYHKQYRLSTRLLAHDETGSAKLGDTVTIEETRPLSARKRWRVVSKV